MGYFKKLQLRARTRDRERRRVVAARAVFQQELEAFQVWAMESAPPGYIPRLLSGVLMALSDYFPAEGSPEAAAQSAMDDPEFCATFPRVWELCSAPVGSDGKVRQLSTLMFFLDGGGWKCRLSERNYGLDLWAFGPTFRASLEVLDAQLAKSPVPWRRQSPLPGARR